MRRAGCRDRRFWSASGMISKTGDHFTDNGAAKNWQENRGRKIWEMHDPAPIFLPMLCLEFRFLIGSPAFSDSPPAILPCTGPCPLRCLTLSKTIIASQPAANECSRRRLSHTVRPPSFAPSVGSTKSSIAPRDWRKSRSTCGRRASASGPRLRSPPPRQCNRGPRPRRRVPRRFVRRGGRPPHVTAAVQTRSRVGLRRLRAKKCGLLPGRL